MYRTKYVLYNTKRRQTEFLNQLDDEMKNENFSTVIGYRIKTDRSYIRRTMYVNRLRIRFVVCA